MSKNDDEVLVRVDGVSKKFCRSLKKSLWYGVCDIASELNPFGRSTGQSYADKNLTTIERHGGRENRRLGKAEEDQLKVAPQRGAASGTMQVKKQLEVGPKGEGVGRTESKETANDASGSGEQTGSDSESAKFDSLDPSHLALRADLRSLHLAPAPALDCGKKSSSALDSGPSTARTVSVRANSSPSRMFLSSFAAGN